MTDVMAHPSSSGFGVTNSAFLREVAQAAPNGTTLWVSGFVGNPDQAGGNWAGRPFNAALDAAMVDGWGRLNTYFSVAALHPVGGELARRKENFARLLVLVADDVQVEDLVGRPSYVLQTSPGRCQVGIFLTHDDPACADLQIVSRVLATMAASGQIKVDRSGNNAVRYVRLPVGQNQKPRPGGAFQCHLDLFDPGVRYSLADAAAVFGIDVDQLQADEVQTAGRGPDTGRTQDALVRDLTSSILAGRNLHDCLNMLAASMVASGMAGGAVVNMLRGLMDASTAPRDERFQARMADIPRAVSTAQQKFAPAVTLSLLRRSVAEQIAEQPEDADEAPPSALQVPAHLMTVPGMLGQAVAWINATARKPQPLFAVQAALALGSVLMGRRYRTSNGNWSALYFLNIGASGSGKEHAKHAVERLLEAAGLASLIGSGRFASESGVVSSLIERPSQFSVLDEFGKTLQAAAVAQNYADRNTLKCLMEVWGRADGVLRPTAYSTAGLSSRQAEEMAKRSVRKPSLTLLALSTPDTLFAGLTSAAVADGFLNRFLTVHSDHGRQLARTVDEIDPPEDLLEWARRTHAAAAIEGNMATMAVPHDMEPTPVHMAIDAGALRVFSDLEVAAHKRMGDLDAEGLAEMLTRTTEMAMRVALVVAVSCGHESILRQDAQWASDYVLCHGERNLVQLRERISDGPFDQLCKEVLRLVRAAGARGCTERDLNKSSRSWRAANLRLRDDALKSLERRGAMLMAEVPGSTGKGRKRFAWVAAHLSARAENADNADKLPTDVSPQ
jgi:hypothetical protein